uniref:FBD domain-containing protein n=1 Tax=Panagrolaimus sp. ES5 TaxID=591445 RepID=A0AC34G0B7_9BILA
MGNIPSHPPSSAAAADDDVDIECLNLVHNLITIVEMLEVKDAQLNEIKLQKEILEEILSEKEAELGETHFENAMAKETIKHQKLMISERAVQINCLNHSVADLRTTLEDLKLQKTSQKKNYENAIHEKKVDHDRYVQRSEATIRQLQNQNAKLEKENSKLIDPDRMCFVNHVAPHGKVDYFHLNGKILLVKKLVIDGEKLVADGIDISLDSSEFQIHVSRELAIKHTTFLTIPKGISYCNIVKLCLEDSSISFYAYKELMESCNIEYLILHRVNVEEYGAGYDVADLIKEVPNIEYFEYRELAIKHTNFLTIPKRISYCNIVKLCLEDSSISFYAYKELMESCNIEYLILHRVNVEESGTGYDVADLIKEVPNIEYFEYTYNKRESMPCHKLAELHPFPRLHHLHLNEIHENFDLKIFVEFMKKNPTAFYELSLRCCPKFYTKVKSVEKDTVPASYKLKITKPK